MMLAVTFSYARHVFVCMVVGVWMLYKYRYFVVASFVIVFIVLFFIPVSFQFVCLYDVFDSFKKFFLACRYFTFSKRSFLLFLKKFFSIFIYISILFFYSSSTCLQLLRFYCLSLKAIDIFCLFIFYTIFTVLYFY